MTEIENIIHKEVQKLYWENDINCARTTLIVLGELFNKKLESQTINSAIGLHGAGGYRAQCGIVEGSLMFISIIAKENYLKNDNDIASLCYNFVSEFEKTFNSISCYDLRPNGFRIEDPPHLCEELTKKGINFCYNYCKSSFSQKYSLL